MKMKRYNTIISIALLFCVAMSIGCGRKSHEYVHTKPREVDVVGSYVLTDQTVIKGGVSALGGRHCQLDLRSDGSFGITNYPNCAGARSAGLTQFNTFISTTGTWKLSSVGTTYDYGPNPKDCWGISLNGTNGRIDSPAFTGRTPPYELVTTLGDPDSNNTLRIKRKG